MQRRQRPHGTFQQTSTRSPGARPSTPSPTLSTSPAPSWPSRIGVNRASRTCETSVWQRPAVSMRTRTSPGPGGSTVSRCRRGRAPSRSRTSPRASTCTALGVRNERVRGCTDPLEVFGRRLGHPLLDELLAALEDLRPALRILAPRLEQPPQPAAAVLGVQRLVRPVELHVRLARAVTHLLERAGALAFATDVLRLEVAEHAEAVQRVLAVPSLVDVAAERNLLRGEAPALEPLFPHQHVARLVVQPARGVTCELPPELGRELVE